MNLTRLSTDGKPEAAEVSDAKFDWKAGYISNDDTPPFRAGSVISRKQVLVFGIFAPRADKFIMARVIILAAVLFSGAVRSVLPGLSAQEVLQGEVLIDLEPVIADSGGIPYPHPINTNAVQKQAVEEAALYFSAMIYGWSFICEVEEKARGIAGNFTLKSRGAVRPGDPGLVITQAELRDGRLSVRAGCRLSGPQQRRLESWRAGTVRNMQAVGYAALNAAGENTGDGEDRQAGWTALKQAALEDAARTGIRSLLREQERNRPKEARGLIVLAEFPRFFMAGGRQAVSARFRVEINEIIPFAVY
jgi:hypothetical protein